ncbi:hypothetical protein Y886_18645 [Xanthomonas hyacinthi DSM 19077]|nr:hypothetical protein Y886_18645 [Xanthomonas hyacinthi DSM 19077]
MDETVAWLLRSARVASCIRQCSTYSRGASPAFRLNLKANVERDTFAISARSSSVQRRAGAAWMAWTTAPMRGSDRARSQLGVLLLSS